MRNKNIINNINSLNEPIEKILKRNKKVFETDIKIYKQSENIIDIVIKFKYKIKYHLNVHEGTFEFAGLYFKLSRDNYYFVEDLDDVIKIIYRDFEEFIFSAIREIKENLGLAEQNLEIEDYTLIPYKLLCSHLEYFGGELIIRIKI